MAGRSERVPDFSNNLRSRSPAVQRILSGAFVRLPRIVRRQLPLATLRMRHRSGSGRPCCRWRHERTAGIRPATTRKVPSRAWTRGTRSTRQDRGAEPRPRWRERSGSAACCRASGRILWIRIPGDAIGRPHRSLPRAPSHRACRDRSNGASRPGNGRTSRPPGEGRCCGDLPEPQEWKATVWNGRLRGAFATRVPDVGSIPPTRNRP